MGVKNSVDLESDPKLLIGTRVFDAPRDLVWTAFTDPKHLANWWGPTGFSITTSAFEFRNGGVWRLVMHGPDGRDYQNRIVFDDIVKPERIVYHHDKADDVEPAHHSTVITFEDLGRQTRIVWSMTFPSAEDRTRIVRDYGADKGLSQTMARLDDYVITLAVTR